MVALGFLVKFQRHLSLRVLVLQPLVVTFIMMVSTAALVRDARWVGAAAAHGREGSGAIEEALRMAVHMVPSALPPSVTSHLGWCAGSSDGHSRRPNGQVYPSLLGADGEDSSLCAAPCTPRGTRARLCLPWL